MGNGSKRRALKNLLSPHSPSQSSSLTSPPSGAPLDPVDSSTSLASASSIASNPNNYLTDEQLETDLELEKMADRKSVIGTGQTASVDLPPAAVPPPPPPQGEIGRQGQVQSPSSPGSSSSKKVFGGAMAAGLGLAPGGGGAVEMAAANGGGGKKKSSKQKFEERQARKKAALLDAGPPSDPNWDAKLERERQEEIKVIGDACVTLGRELFEIEPDGHCIFRAIADQLGSIGLIPPDQAHNPKVTRTAAAHYMRSNPDEFRFFLPSVNGEDTKGATEHDGVMTEKEFEKYCQNVESTGEWGGEPEIQALSRAFQVPIHVIQRGPPTVVSHGGNDDAFGGGLTPEQSKSQGDRVVRISYHRRMYGLGEHYNSLRKVQT